MGKFRFAPAFDLRSLGLFRIFFGGMVLLDLAIRSTALREHYTDLGILTRADLVNSPGWGRLDLYLIAGTPFGVSVLFIIAALFAIALVLGYRTRWALFFTWILMISLQARNEYVINSGDVLFRVMAFWSLFLPLGNRFSVDAVLAKRSPETLTMPTVNTVAGIATLAFACQLVYLYLFAGILKIEQPSWRDGQGLAYAVWSLAYVNPIGTFLQKLPGILLVIGNWFTLVLELPGALIPLIPMKFGRTRLLGVAFFIAFHFMLEAAFAVGMFSLIASTVWLALVPTYFWNDPLGQRIDQALDRAFRKISSLFGAPESVEVRGSGPLNSYQHRAMQIIPAISLLIATSWNLSSIQIIGQHLPLWVQSGWISIGMDQRWEMFSKPITEAAWLSIPAKYSDGSEKDLFTGDESPRYVRPDYIASDFPNDRWRKLYLALEMNGRDSLRMAFGKYYCHERTRNQPGDAPLATFLILRYSQGTDPFHPENLMPVHTDVLWRHECFDGALERWEADLKQLALPPARRLTAVVTSPKKEIASPKMSVAQSVKKKKAQSLRKTPPKRGK